MTNNFTKKMQKCSILEFYTFSLQNITPEVRLCCSKVKPLIDKKNKKGQTNYLHGSKNTTNQQQIMCACA